MRCSAPRRREPDQAGPRPTALTRAALFAASPGECRHLEAAAISAGRHAGRALEEPAEERGILVADLPADLVGCGIRPLQPALGVLDAQALHVLQRSKAGRLSEAALGGALGEPG